jgi:hypothetical protein
MVQPNAVADDFAREPVAAVAIRISLHREVSPAPAQVDNTSFDLIPADFELPGQGVCTGRASSHWPCLTTP